LEGLGVLGKTPFHGESVDIFCNYTMCDKVAITQIFFRPFGSSSLRQFSPSFHSIRELSLDLDYMLCRGCITERKNLSLN